VPEQGDHRAEVGLGGARHVEDGAVDAALDDLGPRRLPHGGLRLGQVAQLLAGFGAHEGLAGRFHLAADQLAQALLDRGGVGADAVDPHAEDVAPLADLPGSVELEGDEPHPLAHLGAGLDLPETGPLEVRPLGGDGDVEPGDGDSSTQESHRAQNLL